MKKNLMIPKIDLRYANLVRGELVVLNSKLDDKDYARVYEVVEEEKLGEIIVKVISENPINPDKYSQSHSAKISLIGKTFKAQPSLFQPYM